MRPEDFDVDKVVGQLQGTCKTLEQGLQMVYPDMTEDDLLPDDLQEIDNEVFKCQTCDWWMEVCDMGDEENNCQDCVDNEET